MLEVVPREDFGVTESKIFKSRSPVDFRLHGHSLLIKWVVGRCVVVASFASLTGLMIAEWKPAQESKHKY